MPVGSYLLWMQTKHGTADPRVMATDIHHRMTGSQVDGWQEDGLATSLTGSLHYGITVVLKLLAVQMTMGVDVFTI